MSQETENSPATTAVGYLRRGGPVIDTHVHLTSVDEVGEYPAGVQAWFNAVGEKIGRGKDDPHRGDFSEEDFEHSVALLPTVHGQEPFLINVQAAVFVEVLPEGEPALQEARWILHDKVDDCKSKVRSMVAHAPVKGGALAVKQYLVGKHLHDD